MIGYDSSEVRLHVVDAAMDVYKLAVKVGHNPDLDDIIEKIFMVSAPHVDFNDMRKDEYMITEVCPHCGGGGGEYELEINGEDGTPDTTWIVCDTCGGSGVPDE